MITYITAAALVLATTLGCSALSSAKKLAGHAVELGKLTELMTNAEKLTYQAEYKDSDGGTDTVAQAPPKVAYLSKDTDYIFTGDTIYNCDRDNGQLTCSKTAETDTADPDSQLADGLGGTFFTGELGITLLAAALLVPQSNVKDSNKTIAGIKSTCIGVSGLSQDNQGNAGASPDPDDFDAFTMCVGDNGVVTNFVGTDTSGKNSGITMTSFSTKVNQSVFGLPAGATITDTNTPTISTGPSTPASASAPASVAPSPAAS